MRFSNVPNGTQEFMSWSEERVCAGIRAYTRSRYCPLKPPLSPLGYILIAIANCMSTLPIQLTSLLSSMVQRLYWCTHDKGSINVILVDGLPAGTTLQPTPA